MLVSFFEDVGRIVGHRMNQRASPGEFEQEDEKAGRDIGQKPRERPIPAVDPGSHDNERDDPAPVPETLTASLQRHGSFPIPLSRRAIYAEGGSG